MRPRYSRALSNKHGVEWRDNGESQIFVSFGRLCNMVGWLVPNRRFLTSYNQQQTMYAVDKLEAACLVMSISFQGGLPLLKPRRHWPVAQICTARNNKKRQHFPIISWKFCRLELQRFLSFFSCSPKRRRVACLDFFRHGTWQSSYPDSTCPEAVTVIRVLQHMLKLQMPQRCQSHPVAD